jgi:hypothetical protein
MRRFWLFIGVGVICFVVAAVFAKFNIVVVGHRYYAPSISAREAGDGVPSADPLPGESRASGLGSHSVDEIRGWAPDVTNAGASAGFAIAGGLCMIAAAMSDRRRDIAQ